MRLDWRRLLVALVALLLAGAAWTLYRNDLRERRRGLAFAHDYSIDLRRPRAFEEATYAGSADGEIELLVDATVDDALGGISLSGLSGEERRAWIESEAKRGKQVATALDLALDAITRRPGWPAHWSGLAEADYAREIVGRDEHPAMRWLVPLQRTREAAPGKIEVASFSAAALLERYARLTPAARQSLPPILAAALAQPNAVAALFPVATSVLGPDGSIALLPNDPSSLQEAARFLGVTGDIARSAALFAKWETSERNARDRDLGRLMELAGKGDEVMLRSAATMWLRHHSAGDFDDESAAQQQLTALGFYPPTFAENWNDDVRAETVQHFMNGRMRGKGRGILKRAVESSRGAPATFVARGELAAGDVMGADDIVHQSMNVGAFEWTPFFVELGHFFLDRADIGASEQAIASIAPSAHDECDVLLLRRRSAEAVHDFGRIAETDALLGSSPRVFPPESWSKEGEVSICIAPSLLSEHTLELDLAAPADELLDLRWNGARERTIFVRRGRALLQLPLGDRQGRWVFQLTKRAGNGDPIPTAIIR